MILKFILFDTFDDLLMKEISSAIINMTATTDMAIILAFVALWEIKFEEMAKIWEKGFKLRILGIFSFLSC